MKKEQAKRGYIRFFQTEFGRKIVFAGAACTTISLFAGNFLPHTFGLKHYRDFVQCYQNGIQRPVPDKVKRRLESALEKLDVSQFERKLIKPFTVFGFDLFTAGSTQHRFGALIGIPVNYAYSDPQEINRQDIRFRNEQINWNSESGHLLQEAIILDENEQIFGFCKCILQLQTHRVLMNSVFPSVSFLAVYTVGQYLNLKLGLLAKPMSLRIVLYAILGLFGFGSWSFMKDYNQVLYDSEIDKKLAAMGPEFVEAGVRFYDKQLKKNMALRALLNDNTYTARGNENYILRQKSLPLTFRKSFFEEKWKTFKEGTEPAEEVLQ